METEIIQKFSILTERFELFIFDIWGVIHDGKQLYPYINLILANLIKLNKKIALLSNSPRSDDDIKKQLQNMGLSYELDFPIITSGEYAINKINSSSLKKQSVFFIAPYSHDSFRNKLDVSFTDDISEANYIICSGFNDFKNKTSDYFKIFETAMKKSLVLHCINPDQYAFVNHQLVPCAGLLAEYYDKMGGKVIYYGKPESGIYDYLFSKFDVARQNSLVIGDSISTDIQGAITSQLSSLLVLTGLHSQEISNCVNTAPMLNKKLSSLFDLYRTIPDYVTKELVW